MKDHIITIQLDGSITMIGDGLPIHELGATTKRRVSRIEPLDPVKRVGFKLLRLIFGEAGKVAAWTRRWYGPWQATILATGEQRVHFSRAALVEWEIERLIE